MLVEDLGRTSFHDLSGVHWSHLEPLYSQALSYLEAIQQLPLDTVAVLNPALDGALLRQEVEISWRALREYRPASLSCSLQRRLETALAGTCDHLEKCELVPCHRDFMPRNLMLTEPEHILGVIDHQDLRLGPAAYDLASLLNDSLFPPPAIEERLRTQQLDDEQSLLLYRRCAVQRTIKAAGTFVRFSELGDDRHLPLVMPTLCRAAYHLRDLPEGGPLAADLASNWAASSQGNLSPSPQARSASRARGEPK
jgi:aminoglycoside/choline kinase family phosphotransferase